MTQDQKIIKNKLGLLKLAHTLGSVSEACKVLGFSRDSFYRFKVIQLEDVGDRPSYSSILVRNLQTRPMIEIGAAGKAQLG